MSQQSSYVNLRSAFDLCIFSSVQHLNHGIYIREKKGFFSVEEKQNKKNEEKQ